MPPTTATSWALKGFVVLAGLLSAGCAGTHLYNKGNDDLAKEIKSDFGKIDVAKVITIEQTNRKEIREVG